MPEAAEKIIPLTVIGGFLGAGKTSLLNHLLHQADGRRYAVLVNDFGALSIDAALVADHGGDTISLANGCVCCTLGDDFMLTVLRLLQAPDRIDHIVVEASGIADPKPIADVAVLHPGLSRDGVAVVCDAETIAARAEDRLIGDTVRRQLRAADIIVLNKSDLVSTETRAGLRHWLAAQAPDRAVVEASHGRVPTVLLFDAALDLQPTAESPVDGHEFRTVTLEFAAPLDEARLRDGIAALPASVLRAKGFIRLAADPATPVLLQLVGRRLEITATPPSARPQPGGSAVVLIGTAAMPGAEELRQVIAGMRPAAIS